MIFKLIELLTHQPWAASSRVAFATRKFPLGNSRQSLFQSFLISDLQAINKKQNTMLGQQQRLTSKCKSENDFIYFLTVWSVSVHRYQNITRQEQRILLTRSVTNVDQRMVKAQKRDPKKLKCPSLQSIFELNFIFTLLFVLFFGSPQVSRRLANSMSPYN